MDERDYSPIEIVLLIAMIIAVLCVVGFVGKDENNYTRNVEVKECGNGVITFCNYSGETWSADWDGDFVNPGTPAIIKLFNNYTSDNSDDVILKINLRN